MPNFVIHARFTCRPEKRDAFIAKYKEIAAHAKQHESECLAFHLSEDPTTANSFALFELSPTHARSCCIAAVDSAAACGVPYSLLLLPCLLCHLSGTPTRPRGR